jgi:hypothetical protein
VDHHEQVAFERDRDALAEPPHRCHATPFHRAERRHRGTQQERVRDVDARQHVSLDARGKGLAVDGDVGQLGHGFSANPLN